LLRQRSDQLRFSIHPSTRVFQRDPKEKTA
jgi:hypothetical protein